MVNFCIASKRPVTVRHECLRIRDTREEALADARGDAGKLVVMWADQVGIDEHH